MKLPLSKDTITVLETLKKSGFGAYIVGGSVRDMLMGRETNDWDFTTNATPDQILALFPDAFYNNTFGTVGVPIKKESGSTNNELREETVTVFEITTYRSESEYTDHRRPDKIIWGQTLEEDLKRRDFTINAMATDGDTIIDPFDGQKDLERHIVRTVGDPHERFSEDALRMMRAIRIATELQFLIDPDTFAAIEANKHLLTKIAWERIRDELLKILESDYPTDGIKLLRNAGILAIILPELESCFGVDQKSPKRHHIYDVGTHLLESLTHCPSHDPIVRLATLLHDIGKPATVAKTPEGVITFYNHEIAGASMINHIATRLRLSKVQREKLYRLVRFHQFTVDHHQTDSAIRRFLRNVGIENIADMLALRTGDRLGGGARETSWRLELFKKRIEDVQKQPFTVADLKVSGHDVMEVFGIKPGPVVGKVLNALFAEVSEEKLPNERAILLKKIEEMKQTIS